MGSEMSSRTFRGSGREGTAMQRHRRGAQERAAITSTDVRLTLPARPENVSVIRHVLGAFAEALRLPDELVEDLRLAVTEACTNVVRHAYPVGQAGPVEISIQPLEESVSVVVSDQGRGIGTS